MNISDSQENTIAGLIERVTFFNPDNGFAVLKVKVKGKRDLSTVIGNLPSVNAGEWLSGQGKWIRNREFGLQFQAHHLACSAPTSREGIEKYLGSGMVKGIGPVYAKKLVAKFGEQIFNVIEERSAALEQIDGIGPKRRRVIKQAWNEQKVVRDIMVFLHSHGVSASRAVRIYKTYGESAVERVSANPYALARDIPGIGFKTADQIAGQLGISKDSPMRLRAGVSHVLMEATSEGHCGLPEKELSDRAIQLLEASAENVELAVRQSARDRETVADEIEGDRIIFLPALKRAEERIAETFRTLAQAPPNYPGIQMDKAMEWCREKMDIDLAPSQREALTKALSHRVTIITGGPGVGKTTLMRALLLILQAKGVRCLLCAPTGRAAKRLSEVTGTGAKTIHRLLGVRSGAPGFQHDEANPLECDLLVADECSMIDVQLMNNLLRALPGKAALLLVGDVDQLPSVGPGNVLADLIRSEVAPVVRLTEVFRQAAHSRIITNAHRVNQGLLPEVTEDGAPSDFYFIEREEPDAVRRTLMRVLTERIPRKFGLDPVADVQVLSPMNRGSLGVRELNATLQQTLNPPKEVDLAVERFGWRFRIGDKVIQTVNNYDKDVFNGDIGLIAGIDAEEQEVEVRYDSRKAVYDFGELDELSLAYAITIHKSQGSEFPAVLIPVSTQQYMLLQRNLIYTGMTRGKRLVVLIGEKKALAIAVKNNKTARRCSGLFHRLKNLA